MIKYRLYLLILVLLFGFWVYFLTKSIIDNDLLFIMLTMFMCMINASMVVGAYTDYKKYKGRT